MIDLPTEHLLLVDCLPDPVLLLDGDRGRIIWVNQQAAARWNLDRDRLDDNDITELIEDVDWKTDCEEKPLEAHFQNRPVSSVITIKRLTGDMADVVMVLVRDNSRVRLLEQELAIVRHNLERKVARRTRELISRERDALYGRMVQGIVHNFRSPLHGLQSSLAVLRARLKDVDPSVYGEPLGLVEEGANRLGSLVNAILTRSRREHNEEATDIDANQLITEELEFLMADPFFKDEVTQNLDLTPDLPRVRGLHGNLSQVVHNLVRNALDAMWSASVRRLTIRTYVWDETVCLDVEDTGPGVPDDLREKIFEPFFTTKPLTRDEPGRPPAGTGLGLAISIQLLRPFNGRLTMDSRPGGPTTFTIQLPLPEKPNRLEQGD